MLRLCFARRSIPLVAAWLSSYRRLAAVAAASVYSRIHRLPFGCGRPSRRQIGLGVVCRPEIGRGGLVGGCPLAVSRRFLRGLRPHEFCDGSCVYRLRGRAQLHRRSAIRSVRSSAGEGERQWSCIRVWLAGGTAHNRRSCGPPGSSREACVASNHAAELSGGPPALARASAR